MGENTEQTTNRKTETTAQMNELNKALLELKKITGISLEVSGAAPEQIEPALTQIHCLCTAYKEKYNRTDFLQGLMTGNIRTMKFPIGHRDFTLIRRKNEFFSL